MNKTDLRKLLSVVLCVVLIAALALTGCGSSTEEETGTVVVTDGATLGEGETSFPLMITDKDGNVVNVTIHTDETTVGAALLEVNLIDGEEGDYGLYIKEVNGIVADYETDGTYWAFYIDGEYAISGVDTTDITDGTTYSLTVE